MKNIIFIAALLLICSTAVSAQKISADKVPASVLNSFKAKFPAATLVKWELEGKDYEAGFKSAKGEQSALFDKDGKWLETETEIKTSALPQAVTATISSQYAGYKIDEPEVIETADNKTLYEVDLVKGKEVLEVRFSADGKVIRSKKESKD